MTGLLITTFNRPEYLLKCLETLSKCDLLEVAILFVDDCSTNKGTVDLIKNFSAESISVDVILKEKNKGVADSLLIGYNYLFKNGCDNVVNLDSDAIVKKDFIDKLLYIQSIYPSNVITGFNTQSKNERGIIRHPVVAQCETHCIKKSAGGINYLISKDIYEKYLKSSLQYCIGKNIDWDNYFCRDVQHNGVSFVCTTPSVVDHIGDASSIGKRYNPDKAVDFNEPVNSIVINQPRGLGDIIFSMKAVLDFANGRKIVWPVMKEFVSIGKHFPEIEFVDWCTLKINYDIRHEYQSEYGLVIPLRFSDSICKVKYTECMKSKYLYFGKEWQEWRGIKIKRDEISEQALFEKTLKGNGIDCEEKYNVVNKAFRTDLSGKCNITPDNELKCITIATEPNFTLIDWSLILEHAEHIYTVGTSINYLIELLELKAKTINLYVRSPDEKDFKNYDYILSEKLPYILHE